MEKTEEWKTCLEALLDVESGLSEWQVNFIESVKRYLTNGIAPRDKVINKIIEIYDKHC